MYHRNFRFSLEFNAKIILRKKKYKKDYEEVGFDVVAMKAALVGQVIGLAGHHVTNNRQNECFCNQLKEGFGSHMWCTENNVSENFEDFNMERHLYPTPTQKMGGHFWNQIRKWSPKYINNLGKACLVGRMIISN